MSRDLEFENFAVEKERAESIRENLARLREGDWVEDLKLLVNELGAEIKDDESGMLSGLLKDQSGKVYFVPADHPAEGFSLRLQGNEFRVFFRDKLVFEPSFLPKGNEFLILQVEETEIPILLNLKETLKDELKAARAKKANRSASIKNRLGQSSSS